MLNESGIPTQDNKQMAEILNKNFASVFTQENTDTIPNTPIPLGDIEPLETGVIQEQEVQKYLDALDANKSTRPDNVSPRLLKELKQQIVKPLTYIFNRSLQLNKVPEDWKLANVTETNVKP